MKDVSHKLSVSERIWNRWNLQDIEVNHTRAKGALDVLHVAGLVDKRRGVDKVAMSWAILSE